MTEKQKQYVNIGMNRAAQVHDDAAKQYKRLNCHEDARRHAAWAKSIRAKYMKTLRPLDEYVTLRAEL